MKSVVGRRAAVAVAGAALAVATSALFGGVALAGGEGHGGNDADGGDGRGPTVSIYCVFHGPTEAGVNGEDGRSGQCSPNSNGNGHGEAHATE
jgi:hypothetical protein